MILPFLPFQPADPVHYDIVDSPVGRILLTGDERALTGLYLLDAGEHSASVDPGWIRRPGGFGAASAQLDGYFAGERTEFDLPLAPRGTRFQLAVWEELARIPYGRRSATATSPSRSASPWSRRARWAWPTGAIRSRSSCPVTG